MKQSGFTLIELLVVIAIIGILASVVLSSLTTARDKGSDAAISLTIKNMQTEAELYYDTNLSYVDMCSASVIQAALTKAGVLNGGGAVTCVDGGDVPGFWAIEAQLVSSVTDYFCIDNDGKAVQTTGSTISDTSGSEDAVCG